MFGNGKSVTISDLSQYLTILQYREVQLNLTSEIEFHMMFERCHTKNRKRSLKQHVKYFHFRSEVSWTTL